MGGETVDPHNLLGIELNPRAAAIAEVVLWIGYLQWHYRTRGNINPPLPVVRDFHNIECRDAVLAYDDVEYVTDDRGVPVTRWDGKTYKASPVTGEDVPDETARVPLERYVNPRRAAWPQADFIVGNPPFIGNKRMRAALGDGYVEALRATWDDVSESADFVMYWWHHAALLTRRGALQRFGFITTNSIRQAFNRRVIEAALAASLPPPGEGARRADEGEHTANPPSSGAARHLLPVGEGKEQPLSLVFAIPDHPWVDSADGAAVRIAMTVGDIRLHPGRLLEVVDERVEEDGEVAVDLHETCGVLHPDLRIGSNVADASPMRANLGVSFMGMIPLGDGFWIDSEEAQRLSVGVEAELRPHLRAYRNGKDILYTPRGILALDFFGMDEPELRARFPAAYQWLLERVKPSRANDKRKSYRDNWWFFAEARPALRRALVGLRRYIGTTETAKHRVFMFLDGGIIPDQKIRVIATDDSAILGVLSSCVHVVWALVAGSRLGVGNDPVYNNSRCFEPFPFPAANVEQQSRIRDLAEQLDAHRKRQQAAHPDLTLTGMYNVLDKLRSGEELTAKERTIHEHGLVSVLRQLHDELDAIVLDAYGWSDLLPLLRVAHGNAAALLLPSPAGRRAGDEGAAQQRLPKAPLPDDARAFARSLRQQQTDAETRLWQLLRDRRLHGMKFRRQHPIPPYTLDFYCRELALAVELDGSQHLDSPRDAQRDAVLAKAGVETVRYWNHDVLERTEQVLEDLWGRVDARLQKSGATETSPSSAPAGHLLPVGEGRAEAKRAFDLPAGEGKADAKRAFDEAILERLVALNAERAAEEARGLVRWLRPDFQNPQAQAKPEQAEMDTGEYTENRVRPERGGDAAKANDGKTTPWPKDAVDQVRAVADALTGAAAPLSVDEIAARFSGRGPWKKRLPSLLDMLVALGRARERGGRYSAG
ncbi:MAG: DUF559 domain-containing protein, partial [Proteobacteria bacterium]|nr:DUF559 domain-containing protein [Pseudomonadota bacterium]